MKLPFFFISNIEPSDRMLLDSEASRHIAQVLRMEVGELVQLTDGRGQLATVQITDNSKKGCVVRFVESQVYPPGRHRISIALSLLKNPARFEWFLEKATEVGVTEIIPLVTTHTEKKSFREERWKGIMISAMLQSQQVWLPNLHAPVGFSEMIETSRQEHRLIAYCGDNDRKTILLGPPGNDVLILIGPEGDFTEEEFQQALAHGFKPVSLGLTRLRSETAALLACILLNR